MVIRSLKVTDNFGKSMFYRSYLMYCPSVPDLKKHVAFECLNLKMSIWASSYFRTGLVVMIFVCSY